MDSGRVGMSQEWSRVVSAEVKKEYMTLQGIQTHCSQLTSQNTKTVKSHLSLTLMRVKLVIIMVTLQLNAFKFYSDFIRTTSEKNLYIHTTSIYKL